MSRVLHCYYASGLQPRLRQRRRERAFKNNGVAMSLSVNDCETQGSMTNFRKEDDITEHSGETFSERIQLQTPC